MFSVAYLGNSVTAQRASFVDPLHQLVVDKWNVNSEPRRAGLGGVGSLAMAGLLDYLVLRHQPHVCFVECSLADAGGATPLERIAVGVESILVDLIDAGISPIMLHLPRIDVPANTQQAVIDIYNSIATDHSVPQIDVRHLATENGFHDGVHTTSEMSDRIAQEIAIHLDDLPRPSSTHSPSSESRKVRFFPAAEGSITVGTSQNSSFRLSIDSKVIDEGSAIRFDTQGATFIGVYVIAKTTSGVIRLQNDRQSATIQVWDPWCTRPRIQFVHVPAALGDECKLEITATGLMTGELDSQGKPTDLAHRGSSLELLGAAVLVSGDHDNS